MVIKLITHLYGKKVKPGFDTSAVEIWAAQQKAKEMREELRDYISLYYGPSAWKAIVNIEVEQRRLQKRSGIQKTRKNRSPHKLGCWDWNCFNWLGYIWSSDILYRQR